MGNIVLDEQELDLVRQWFNALQDLNPKYLEKQDFELAVQIHEALGAKVPLSVREGAV